MIRLKASVARWKHRLYDSREGWADGTTRFAAFVGRRLHGAMRVLDLGAGPGKAGPANFEDRVACRVGLDPDLEIKRNPHVHHRVVGTGEKTPFADETFDLVYSDWVVEHLEEPERVAAEVYRILKPGGFFLFRTGNLGHYVFAIAALTPHWFHKLVSNRVQGRPGDPIEPYETYYRMNTPGKVRRVLSGAGFIEDELKLEEVEPAYLMFSVPSLLIGAAYERIVSRFAALSPIRGNIFASFRKQTRAGGRPPGRTHRG